MRGQGIIEESNSPLVLVTTPNWMTSQRKTEMTIHWPLFLEPLGFFNNESKEWILAVGHTGEDWVYDELRFIAVRYNTIWPMQRSDYVWTTNRTCVIRINVENLLSLGYRAQFWKHLRNLQEVLNRIQGAKLKPKKCAEFHTKWDSLATLFRGMESRRGRE